MFTEINSLRYKFESFLNHFLSLEFFIKKNIILDDSKHNKKKIIFKQTTMYIILNKKKYKVIAITIAD